MSRETGRETDSSSSGAQGRGGAAYPSGTPPYGSRQYPSLHPTQDAPEETAAAPAPPEEPKTETTLTTRIRINIPGSRPIPPVVVRKTVNETSAPDPEPVAQPEPEPEPVAPAPEPPRAAEEAPQAPKAKETSDWFAPRKAAAPSPTPAPAPAPTPTPAAKAAPAPAGPDAPGTGFAGSATSGVPTVGTTPSSRPVTASAPTPPGNPLYETGTPAGGTPMYDGTPAGGTPLYDGTPAGGTPMHNGTPAGGTPMYNGTPAGGTPMYDGTPAAGTPMYDGTPAAGTPLYDGTPAAGTPAHRGPGRPGGQGAPGAPAAPTGPTTGPVTGTASLGGPGAPRPFGGNQGAGSPFAPGGGAPRMSDDTAILTPQQPAPAPRPGPGATGDHGAHISGDTLTSGIPVVPPTAARPNLTPRIEEHASPAPAPAPRQTAAAGRAPAKKGRSKLVLAAAGILGIVGVAYGAGLLLNHSDVPKGTTVLGVDIGGGTKEEAVEKLDAVFGKRATTPLQLGVGGKKVQLAPDKAGLALDSQETVRAAAGSDYNPVSVIGSLFGEERVAKPVFPVDKEKLAVALTDLAGSSASATEGTILFAPNKVTPVEGKPGQGLDVQRSMISVQDAFRAQVETGQNKLVELPVTTRRPTVSKAELDRAMKEFAKPAMSGLIRIQAGGRHIDFGPARSLPQILSMKAVDGRLVEVYDKKAIERLLDGAFDGVMITKGDGTKHQVSADDVAFVMRDALRGKTLAERTKTIDLTGEG
ncbi:hypothetical protein [Streptomyces sp. TLI_105]|uniref:hypothetical protein n=1 Tax=Streptomyces sp. TLI_105 TaxID=1881019 RepID=UPI00089D9CF9|nr:hypothetical protein [Streptomyces sp. TLI_105]SEC57090.1 hypothetical protein SAMN05428939_2702 [Streptomyces sp. TLI_105]